MYYEVVIVGGGISGVITALALSSYGINSCIIEEKKQETLMSLQEDGRAFALAYGGWKMLEKFNINKLIESYVTPIEHIRVAYNNSDKHLDFYNELVKNLPLGYMLEHNLMIKTLYDKVINDKNIKLYAGANYKNIKFHQDYLTIELEDILIESKLLIAADGKNSKLRSTAAIDVKNHDYNQTSIVFNVEHEKFHHNIALEHFYPTGPLAVLPLKGGFSSSVVWTEKKEIAENLLKLNESDFMEALEEKFTDYLGKLKISGKIYSYPLICRYAKKFYSKRMALVADSAHAVHPIAGQGLNIGLFDIEVLVDKIKTYKMLHLDYGSDSFLEEYHKERYFEVMKMVYITDLVNKFFSNDSKVISFVKQFGIAAINKFDIVKKYIMIYAMGI